jgi:general secretion pathway protein C
VTKREQRIAVALVLVTLVLDALFLAQGVTRLVASALLPLETAAAAPNARIARAARAAVSDRADGTQILQRNIFDSETGDVTRIAVAEPTDPAEGPAEPLDPNAPLPRCDGAVRLVGALANTRRPDWSFAAITDATGKAMLYREGMQLDGRTLLHIRSASIIMSQASGNACQLTMFEPPAAGGPPRAVASIAAPPEPAEEPGGPAEAEGGISAADMESGITRVSDTQFTVTRGLVDSLLENQAELMRTARIIPHEEGGRTVGVKLYGIRRNSLLGRLGLQNGDMLRTINGYDMASPDSALEAYSRLRGANNLSVNVVRRGQATSLEYTIQ